MDERRLERALREGPSFGTPYVVRPLRLDPLDGRPSASSMRLAILIAVTALLLVGLLAGLAALGGLIDPDRRAANGWVAFAASDGAASAELDDRDIYLVAENGVRLRIIGDDSEQTDQICPAFSPNGRRLAYGQAEGRGADFGVGPDGEVIVHESNYRRAELNVVDIDADGNASDSQTIEVGGSLPPPCATWSADGQRVAFVVSMTSWNNPELSAPDSEVWVVTLASATIDVIPDVFATDLAWSPVSPQLAIANHVAGESLSNGAISLYSADSGEVRTLVGPSGVSKLSWSPDGLRIVSQRGENAEWTSGPRPEGGRSLWVTELDGSRDYLIADGFDTDHGIGPEWSPRGEWIVYQPICDESHVFPGAPCREESDVVLIPADGDLESRNPGDGEVVIPHLQLPGDDGSVPRSPYRVTWSPDGKELLYWTFGGPTLAAVPIDGRTSPLVLQDSEGGFAVSVYGGDGLLPTQSWAKSTEDEP